MSRARLTTLKPRLSTANPGGWKPDTVRGNRHQRGYGAVWERTRERILQRDAGLCQPHLKRGEMQLGNQVDHITSKAEARARGWTTEQIEDDANLQTICTTCHREKTSSESKGGG
jgi:5-methylcytosine-specific restriction protein A